MLLVKLFIFLWQLPQNILGLLMVLVLRAKSTSYEIKRSDQVQWIRVFDSPWNNAVSLGFFIIVDIKTRGPLTVLHEYGHCIQSRRLGPLYLIIVGIPSILRNIYSRIFINNKMNYGDAYDWYYSGYPEKQADKLAAIDRPKLGQQQ